MEFKQLFRITGVANQITHDAGLLSTQSERKRLLYLGVQITGYAGNDIQGYHERAKIFDIPDTLLDVEIPAFTENESKPGARITQVEVGIDIPVGEKFTAAIKCGATAKNLVGFYAYEIITG
jgi:hypothetical protein